MFRLTILVESTTRPMKCPPSIRSFHLDRLPHEMHLQNPNESAASNLTSSCSTVAHSSNILDLLSLFFFQDAACCSAVNGLRIAWYPCTSQLLPFQVLTRNRAVNMVQSSRLKTVAAVQTLNRVIVPVFASLTTFPECVCVWNVTLANSAFSWFSHFFDFSFSRCFGTSCKCHPKERYQLSRTCL